MLTPDVEDQVTDAYEEFRKQKQNRKFQLFKKITEIQAEMSDHHFRNLARAFRKLSKQADDPKPNRKLSSYYLTEASILKNFEFLFDHKCKPFASLLYLKLAKMKDSVRIDFLRFHEVFKLLVDDGNTNNGNRAAFGLLDIRDKGQLDVMIILSLLNNLDRDSLLAQELMLLLRHHKQKNVLTPGAHRRPTVLNQAVFNDVIPRSCLVDEL